ncbi:hypothetical protein [Moritella viscosa]|uniref:hypothetical protein n=1 Tax=Moritella viscosa TaxID=80854 RepID=UPI00091D50BB|nr:hypothetical protein [Moritella viscosa]SHO16031.1 Two component transcriptional regulator [Moritella viscosa]SHO18848.1 Two component transcriptional regulator [Moritella viscosa]
MKQLKDKEKGLYFELYGNLVTEREYIKEWCSEITGNTTTDDDFCEKYGFDYDLDDDEIYENFLHHFDYEVEKNRKEGFTFDLDPTDLLHSRVSLPNEEGLWDFEDCDLETTEKILEGLEVKYFSGNTDLDFEELDIYECEKYISYIDNDNLIFKSEANNTNYSLTEFIEFQVERFDGEVSEKQIHEALGLVSKLPKSQRLYLDIDVIDVDNSTDTYAMFEMKYADAHWLLDEESFYIHQGSVYDVDFELVEEDELIIGDISFTDCILEQHSNSPQRKLNDKNKLQNDLAIELNETHPEYRVLKMHNDEENRTLSKQVETLSNNTLRLGDCDYEEGYLVNHQNMLAFVIPEKNLEQKALFEDAQSKFNFSSDKITFQFKDSEGDIDYLVRENHQKGFVELKDQYYQVFEKKPDCSGDATTAIFLKVDEDFALKKICEIEEEKLESVYGVKLDYFGHTTCKNSLPIAYFLVPKHNSKFIVTLDKNSELSIDNTSVFEDAVDSGDLDFEPSDEGLKSSLGSLVKAKSKFNHKPLSVRKIKSQELTVDAPTKKKTRSLRM